MLTEFFGKRFIQVGLAVSVIWDGVRHTLVFFDLEKDCFQGAVIQRIKRDSVKVNSELISKIGHGLLIFPGIGKDDTCSGAVHIALRSMDLRISANDEGKI
ncbi:MAG: D-aminoacyl-tRNA deacylase [Candidatus Scalindua sp.]|nr:D-aminoacyl-tRNA deacylase [Candidatus Scalindua sp.]MDV5166223.1 D-aminoacyl-tRNA deacylase [Candidatus Scalindua sp.]